MSSTSSLCDVSIVRYSRSKCVHRTTHCTHFCTASYSRRSTVSCTVYKTSFNASTPRSTAGTFQNICATESSESPVLIPSLLFPLPAWCQRANSAIPKNNPPGKLRSEFCERAFPWLLLRFWYLENQQSNRARPTRDRHWSE